MAAGHVKNSELKARLSRYRQIKLTVIGRKTGETISIPVWFVLEGEKLYLLPVHGSDSHIRQVDFDLVIQAVLCWSGFYGLRLVLIGDPLRGSIIWVANLRLA